MDDAYELFYKGKIWLLLGLIGLVSGGCFALMGYTLEDDYSGSDGMMFLGIVILCVSIYSIYYSMHYKERISAELYEQMLFIRNCKALNDECNKYLTALEKDGDYFALKELYSYLPVLYNEYGSAVINAPLQLTKPVSPYTAGLLGTQVGGGVVGMLAAQSAIEKQKAYEQNVQKVISAKLNTGNALDKLKYCYASIEAIINNNTITKKDWQREKELIQEELDEDYSISLFL